ncbi:asparaginase [Hamadaea sp. NPDC050747]|uniref:asparaginase n=1 Tax=Hamadaea sp. NPDC050747 TaxID=3155789 RepID=UPI00340FD8AD
MAGTNPRVTVITLGGTISMSGSTGLVAPTLSAADLVAAIPGLDGTDIDVHVRDLMRIPGGSLTFTDILTVHDAIREELEQGSTGTVVVQGTDTIEESAYLLQLLHDAAGPIVVTGAMRNPTQPSPDGPANLLAAIRVAADERSRGRGCLVVLNDQVHAARHVAKTHTIATNAFASGASGPLGWVVEGEVRYGHPPVPRATKPRRPLRPTSPATVGMITATLGDDGSWISDFAQRFDGLVVAGFGAGHVPMTWADHLEKACAQQPVVLASRITTGPSLTNTYGFTGSESDLISRGLIPSGDLGPYKARVLLWALLADSTSPAGIRAAFTEHNHA